MRISAPQASSYEDADGDWHARQNHILGIDDDEDDDDDEDEEEEEDEDEEEEAHASHVTPRKQRKCCPVESAVAAVLFSFGKLPSQLLSACRPPRFVAEVPHISQLKASSSKLRGALRRTSAWPRIVA